MRTILGVEVTPAIAESVGLLPVQLDDPNIDLVDQCLTRWHGAARAVQHVDSWTPYRMVGWYEGGHGCMSGNQHPDHMGGRVTIFSSIDDPIGGADGFIHESAHQKLHLLGMQLEEHDGTLITNDCERRFFSPIRRDVLRPLSALIHGIYAWVHMLEIELANDALPHLSLNVPKVRMGMQTIKEFVQPTEAGLKFLAEFYEWGDSLVQKGALTLSAAGVAELPVPGLGE